MEEKFHHHSHIINFLQSVNLELGYNNNVTVSLTTHAGIAKEQAPYGWTTLHVLHLTLCCQHAHIAHLGLTTVVMHSEDVAMTCSVPDNL
jgi:hypothetical protein